ncbi:MAG: CapA family protein [Deltaproteobacteria bacterium]|nr:CapA family protein [Deltaproteobacteria bacterium]
MTSRTLTVLAVGDLILDRPDAESFFEFTAPTLRSADVVVGQGEVVFTSRGVNTYTEIPAPPSDPKNMSALPFAGFNVITLAGNHVWDSGAPGIEDTIAGLREYGIAVTGAGMNIDEARVPAIIERDGIRFGFLSYNCVGPQSSWATPDKPGCAYVHILTHCEVPNLLARPQIYTFAEPHSLKAMVDDIQKLRSQCDVLIVALHKGVGHTAAELAMYDQQVPYAAIDAGADLILGHHAHILKGIEWYRDKVIFHGLCNFVTVTRALWPEEAPSWNLREHAKRRMERMQLDREYLNYPFHPEARQTIIAKCSVEQGRISCASFLPCLIDKQGRPEILRNDDRGRKVFQYMDKITREAGLNARFEWEDDEILVCKG